MIWMVFCTEKDEEGQDIMSNYTVDANDDDEAMCRFMTSRHYKKSMSVFSAYCADQFRQLADYMDVLNPDHVHVNRERENAK